VCGQNQSKVNVSLIAVTPCITKAKVSHIFKPQWAWCW